MSAATWVSSISLGLLSVVAVTGPVAADDGPGKAAPLVVVSTSVIEELAADYRYCSSFPEAKGWKAAAEDVLVSLFGKGALAQLDKTRPLGAAVFFEPGESFPFPWEPRCVAFIPVVSLREFLASLSPTWSFHETEEGVFVTTFSNLSLFAKEHDGWACVSDEHDTLTRVPADPLEMLGALPGKYDLAIRVVAGNMPQEMRKLAATAIEPLRADVARRPGEDPDLLSKRRARSIEQVALLRQAAFDLEELTLGVCVDREQRMLACDAAVRFGEESRFSRRAEGDARGTSTKFSGFVDPEASVAFHFSSDFSKDPLLQAITCTLLEHTGGQIDPLTNELFSELNETFQQGAANAGLALAGKGPFTLLVGMNVLRPERVAEILKQMLLDRQQQGRYECVAVQHDVAPHGDVRFSRIRIFLHGRDQQSFDARFFGGPEIEIVIGVDQPGQAAYVAAGPDGLRQLETAIERSAAAAKHDLPAMLVSLRLAPLVGFAAATEPDNEQTAAALQTLLPGEDDITFWARHDHHGYHIRLFQVGEGVLRALWAGMLHSGRRASSEEQKPERPGRDAEVIAEGRLRFAEKFERDGKLAKARSWYEKTIEASPHGEAAKRAKERLEQLEAGLGDSAPR